MKNYVGVGKFFLTCFGYILGASSFTFFSKLLINYALDSGILSPNKYFLSYNGWCCLTMISFTGFG